MRISGSDRMLHDRFLANISMVLLFLVPAILFYAFQKSIFYYQESNSLFIYSCEYFRQFAGRPGGLLEYAGLFLIQGYFSPLYGSLIISAVFVSIAKFFLQTERQLNSEKNFSAFLWIIPSCMLMILQRRFDHSMVFNLGILSTLLWFLLSLKLNQRFRVLIPLLFPFIYYLSGSFSFIFLLMFAVYCAVYEKGYPALLLTGALLISAFCTFMIFKKILFLQPDRILLFNPLQKYSGSSIPALFFVLSGYFIFFPLAVKLISRYNGRIPVFFHATSVLILLAFTGFFLKGPYDPVASDDMMLERLITEQDWNEVIRRHESTPSTSITGQYYYNIALAETGQLCSRLFAGRQDFGAGSLSLSGEDPGSERRIYYYYAVGLVNEVQHLAVESFVKNGYRPGNISFMIRCDIINGNYRVARRYITILKKTLHYRNRAKNYETMLADTSLIFSDPELGKKIRSLPKNDFFIKPVDSLNVESVLKSDPGNKTAFEYRMARLLFEKDLQKLVREAAKMKEIGYTYYPGYIGEAILEGRRLDIENACAGTLMPDSAAQSRFRQYLEDYDLNSGYEKPQFEEKMKKSWGDTYWFYYDFK